MNNVIVPPDADRYTDPRSGQRDRRAQRKFTLERALLLLGTCASVLGFTFSLGMNYNEISALKAKQSAHEDYSTRTYLRGDVYNSDQRSLRDAIDRLSKVVEKMEDRDARENVTTPRSRMFDR